LIEGTVEDNIRFAADLGGRNPDVPQLLDLAGLNSSFAGRDASKLSVGEQQRAMLARALALEPQVLLLDEPTSSLDASATGAVEATLLDLRERVEVSTVLVTHDLAQARRMADWVVRLDEGRVVGEGRVTEQLAV
jgi:ABC-type sulfate/molybdate transport systems ATPase subunit